MANNPQNTSNAETRRFDKSLNENLNDFHLPDNSWTHGRNVINNSKTGDLGKLGNEPATLYCVQIGTGRTAGTLTAIGTIHVIADKWLIFSVSDTTSEIGYFQESTCTYVTLVQDPCLNFSKYHLIKGVSRSSSDCTYKAYWDDGLNPSRFITVDLDAEDVLQANIYTNPNSPIPWIQDCVTTGNCVTCTNKPELDCDKIRLAPFITPPCIKVSKGVGNGTLPNGSYFIAVAYALNGQKIGDYTISNVQPLFDHRNTASSLDLTIVSVDPDFDEMIIVLVATVNQQTVAKKAGVYSTRQLNMSFDMIDNRWETVPVEQLPLMIPVPERTDAMFSVGDYLIRSGVVSKEDFNYQPLANQIVTRWVNVRYPADYYRKGGNRVGYLRDEVYPFFIRWVYDTGDKSNSYHIPGRPFNTTLDGGSSGVYSDKLDAANIRWQCENTAAIITNPPGVQNTTSDGGLVIARGLMGYWESTERYPDNKPQVWNAYNNPLLNPLNNPGVGPFNTGISPYNGQGGYIFNADNLDLCGKPIRHHKFPDNYIGTDNRTNHFEVVPGAGGGIFINIMGVEFDNIKPPIYLDGTPIPGIIGYEILRGTRSGNKSIVAKGVLANMARYKLPEVTFGSVSNPDDFPAGINSPIPTGDSGLEYYYPNYPYNDRRPDPFLSVKETNYNPPGILGGDITNAEDYELQNATFAYQHNMLTFHSPDTNFFNPYLSSKELKVYEELIGYISGQFQYSEKHPGEKLISNNAFLVSAVAGLALGTIAMQGKRTKIRDSVTFNSGPWSQVGVIGSGVASSVPPPGIVLAGLPAYEVFNSGFTAASNLGMWLVNSIIGGGSDIPYGFLTTARDAFVTLGAGAVSADNTYSQESGAYDNLPLPLRVIASAPLFLYYFTEGTDNVMELIKSILRYQLFVLRYESHCWYSNSQNYNYEISTLYSKRSVIKDQQFIGPQISNFSSNKRINNLYRVRTVAIETDPVYITGGVVNYAPTPRIPEVSRIRATEVDSLYDALFGGAFARLKRPNKFPFSYTGSTDGYGSFNQFEPSLPDEGIPQKASALYVGLKQRIRNQYGQLNNITQIYATDCIVPYKKPSDKYSGIVFGGDTYVGRYTEKNTFYYFYDWMYDQPDGAQFNYTKYYMIPYPRYWGNFDQFETSDFVSSIGSGISNIISDIGSLVTNATDQLGNIIQDIFNGGGVSFNDPGDLLPNSLDSYFTTPSDFYNLDGLYQGIDWSSAGNILQSGGQNLVNIFSMSVKNAYFYLFNSGVKDFFVESDINIDLRDWGDNIEERHFDPYLFTDLKSMFDTKIIKSGNYYKYDISLSISNLFLNYVSWSTNQIYAYDPFKAETCYIYSPTKVIYSLPAQYEGIKDQWRIFLPLNNYIFDTNVTAIKPINKSGAIILFDAASPVMFQGTDQLETTIGTKLTIGDGGLFSQPLQNIVNADFAYEYGSCQDRLSVINTPVGVYWISQNQGKIFNMTNGIEDITLETMKWWFAQYLPYRLTQQFPEFELTDNPVSGIGCQAIYDNENSLLYFLKKDYQLKPGINAVYLEKDKFLIDGILTVTLGDPTYFDDASWTATYDPKLKQWLGWNDWHPDLLLPGKNTFMSINKTGSYVDNNGTTIQVPNSIWIHNQRADLYCNYYGIDYPFEVEYTVNTIQEVNTLRSIEYIMEVYKYAVNEYDRFHVLDFNFDEAVVYNTEQTSGLLKLNLNPILDPTAMIAYPIINPTSIDVLYSKVENKFRVNQFWDVTDDRGQFNPNAQRTIWDTEPNGYIRALNPFNLNYNKPEFQRKKFRHYTNSVFLRRKVSGDRKMLVMLANDKLLNSPR